MARSLIAFVFVLLATPVHAQFFNVVYDPSNWAETSVTAFQSKLMVEQLLIMATRLPGMDRFRLPRIPPMGPFVPRTIEQLMRPHLPTVLGPMIASHAQQIDLIDEAWDRAQHRIGAGRLLDDEALTPALESLMVDITSPDSSRSMTAALDTLNASEFVARRQGQVSQELLSSILELTALGVKRQREAEFEALLIRAGHMMPREYMTDEGDSTAWSRWSLPER